MAALKRPTIYVDTTNYRLFLDEVKVGVIKQVSPMDASLLSNHFQSSPDTMYCACSGVRLHSESNWFKPNQDLIALEWVRVESNPQSKEPECNAYRYLFGISKDGKQCWGIEVTRPTSGEGQVVDHWDNMDRMYRSHFPDGKPEQL